LFTSVLVNIQLTKGSQIEPRDIIVFDWEKDAVKSVEIPTEEDVQRILERDKKILHG